MLGLALRKRPADLVEFLNELAEEAEAPESFVYRRWDEKRNEHVPTCSETSLKQTAALCITLKLMKDKTGGVTSIGERAASPGMFDRIVTKQTWDVLTEEFGLTQSKLAAITQSLLNRRNPELPTVDAIWEQLSVPGDLMRFKRFMRLLAQCGGIRASQKLLYLPL